MSIGITPARTKIKVAEAKEWINQYKKSHPCEICGETRIECLVFHHINTNEKNFNISQSGARNICLIQKEIKKCRILCSNCHKVLHKQLRADNSIR